MPKLDLVRPEEVTQLEWDALNECGKLHVVEFYRSRSGARLSESEQD